MIKFFPCGISSTSPVPKILTTMTSGSNTLGPLICDTEFSQLLLFPYSPRSLYEVFWETFSYSCKETKITSLWLVGSRALKNCDIQSSGKSDCCESDISVEALKQCQSRWSSAFRHIRSSFSASRGSHGFQIPEFLAISCPSWSI